MKPTLKFDLSEMTEEFLFWCMREDKGTWRKGSDVIADWNLSHPHISPYMSDHMIENRKRSVWQRVKYFLYGAH